MGKPYSQVGHFSNSVLTVVGHFTTPVASGQLIAPLPGGACCDWKVPTLLQKESQKYNTKVVMRARCLHEHCKWPSTVWFTLIYWINFSFIFVQKITSTATLKGTQVNVFVKKTHNF